MMIRVAVRCCCQPQKILGWLPLDEAILERGVGSVAFPIPTMRSAGSWSQGVPSLAADVVTLPLATYQDTDGSVGVAFKSEETPIATLQRIPGFVAAPDPREDRWLAPWPFPST